MLEGRAALALRRRPFPLANSAPNGAQVDDPKGTMFSITRDETRSEPWVEQSLVSRRQRRSGRPGAANLALGFAFARFDLANP
jgi:hypothetical protein